MLFPKLIELSPGSVLLCLLELELLLLGGDHLLVLLGLALIQLQLRGLDFGLSEDKMTG